MGDVKLSGLIGLFLGFQFFLFALWFAALGGMVYGLFRRAISPMPRFAIKVGLAAEGVLGTSQDSAKIPFGAFLAVASVLVLLNEQFIARFFEIWLIWF